MTTRSRSPLRLACGVASLLALAACSSDSTAPAPHAQTRAPATSPAPEGRLAVMSAGSAFRIDAPPGDWIVQGNTGDGRPALQSVNVGGVAALELRTGPEPVVAVRRVDAMMLATPFLTWSWNLSDHGAGTHPMRIVVGFLGGAPRGGETPVLLGGGLPVHDRALALVWGDSMLGRGTLKPPPQGQPLATPHYIVRGGRENTRKWWLESVDLSRFYQNSWPRDDFRNTRITFIGIAAGAHQPTIRGRVSGIVLTH